MKTKTLVPILALVAIFCVALGLAILISAGAQSEEALFDSGDLQQAATYSYTFNDVGTFTYHCAPHPFMTGTIEVAEDADREADAAVAIEDLAFAPVTLRVAPGTTVTWTNLDAVVHTVTSDDAAGAMTEDKGGDAVTGGDPSAKGSPAPALGILMAGLGIAALAGRRQE